MSYNEESAKRDAAFFKAYAKDRTLTRTKYYAEHPIKPATSVKGFVSVPRDFGASVFAPSEDHKKVYTKLAGFCKLFPDVEPLNLMLWGATGTGKTYTAQIIANRMLDRGISVYYTTAFSMVTGFQKYVQSFGRDTDEIDKLLDCELLIIDDLGTEPTIKNITQEHICNILNERLLQHRGFIITTNLSPADIKQRYDQRIASRILSRETSTLIEFKGEDLRLK